MKEFPLWRLLLSGISLVPLLFCPLFLFGGVHPFGVVQSAVLRAVIYIAMQCVWIAPIALFFVSLDAYRLGYPLRSLLLASLGVALTVGGIAVLFACQ